MAAVGYLHYGEQVQQQVTMSFQPGLGTTIVTWLIVVNGVTKFVLTLAPLAMGMEATPLPSTPSTRTGRGA